MIRQASSRRRPTLPVSGSVGLPFVHEPRLLTLNDSPAFPRRILGLAARRLLWQLQVEVR